MVRRIPNGHVWWFLASYYSFDIPSRLMIEQLEPCKIELICKKGHGGHGQLKPNNANIVTKLKSPYMKNFTIVAVFYDKSSKVVWQLANSFESQQRWRPHFTTLFLATTMSHGFAGKKLPSPIIKLWTTNTERQLWFLRKGGRRIRETKMQFLVTIKMEWRRVAVLTILFVPF